MTGFIIKRVIFGECYTLEDVLWDAATGAAFAGVFGVASKVIGKLRLVNGALPKLFSYTGETILSGTSKSIVKSPLQWATIVAEKEGVEGAKGVFRIGKWLLQGTVKEGEVAATVVRPASGYTPLSVWKAVAGQFSSTPSIWYEAAGAFFETGPIAAEGRQLIHPTQCPPGH